MTHRAKSDRWYLIEEIFQKAVERPESERRNYVKEACGGDEGLRSEVESLLASDSGGNTVQNLIAGDIKDLEHASSSSETGQQVGPYRLIRELDSGGMGAVFLGVRSDDQYFQIVAVKMMRKGMESPALIQRFRAERQILATLKHPNIGAILDGGETDDGRPYIVMEYVEGQPITQASESRGLVIRQRVELFRSLCSAIHYAHQKLIIHRDIKPSNVLVTAEGIVKLIDFGISKPLAPEILYGEMPQTETSQRLLTPDYASPEQILGKDLTTASDIYSLGVLLFELLTGTQPYTLRELSAAAAERLVCEQEIRKPSQVAGLSRQTKRELAGDLDRIIQMAVDPDPARRYLSAQHFEEDLVRYLKGKPIAARKATAFYRLRKFIYRHKTAAVMTFATIAVVVCAILFDSWRSRRAARRVNQIETLADSTISDMTDKLQNSSAPAATQVALLHSTLHYLDQLRQGSGNDPHALLALAKAYQRIGDVQGSPSSAANLGDPVSAVTSYQAALQTALEAHARLPDDDSSRVLIETYQRLANIQSYSGSSTAARDSYQHALLLARDLWRQKPREVSRIQLLVTTEIGLGELDLDDLEPDQAMASLDDALQVFGDNQSGNEDHDRTLLILHWTLGRLLQETGHEAEALASFRRSIAIDEDLARTQGASQRAKATLTALYLAMIEPLAGQETLNLGDSKQARVYARQALDMAQAETAADPTNDQARSDLMAAYAGMADSILTVQPDAAAGWYRKAIAMNNKLADREAARNYMAELEDGLADALIRPDQAAERLGLLEDSHTIREELIQDGRNGPRYQMFLMRSYCKLGDAELAVDDIEKAKHDAALALPFFNMFKVTSPSLIMLRDLGLCYETLGNVQRHIAIKQSASVSERRAAAADEQQWYLKSAAVWNEWKRRGAATPASERERLKVEHLLATTQQNDRNSLPVAQ